MNIRSRGSIAVFLISFANLGTWLWRVTEESLRGSSTGLARQTRYRYERGTGNLLERREMNDAVIRTYAYDRYGNGIRETDPNGNVTVTEYDGLSHTHPVRVTRPATNGVSHATAYEAYDDRFGKPTQVRDENGNVTRHVYDGFGRLVQTFFPDGGGEDGHIQRSFLSPVPDHAGP